MEESEILSCVQQHPFFDGMQPRHVALAAGCVRHVRVPERRHVFRQDGDADEFYLLREGRVALRLAAEESPSLLGCRDLLGLSCNTTRRWSCDAIVVKPAVAIGFDVFRIEEEWEADREFGVACLSRMCQIVHDRPIHATLQALDVYG